MTPPIPPQTRSTWRPLALVLALALVLGGGWKLYETKVQFRLGAVSGHLVYKSGAMPSAHLAAVAKDLGLRSVIDLRTFAQGQDSTNTTPLANIQAERATLEAIGVRHIHLPTGQVPNQETVDQFLAVMADPRNLPTLIHCYHGIGRTELFVAVYRMEFEGWSNTQARAATRFLLAGSSFSDTSEKGRYLISYQPKIRTNASPAGPLPPGAAPAALLP